MLSIAAGVPLARLEAWLGDGVAVVRAMPNTPALVGCRGGGHRRGTAAAAEDDLAWAESILSAVGIVERVGEHLLDAVTGLSGSGPAYVFLVAEALIDAGVLAGLSRPGGADAGDPDPARLGPPPGRVGRRGRRRSGPRSPRRAARPRPASGPSRRAAVRSAFIEAVAAATERSRELGRG